MPNWMFDVLCVHRGFAEHLAGAFRLRFRQVGWHPSSPGDAVQIDIPVVGDVWFDHRQLAERVAAEYGGTGARCDACGVWRWFPLGFAPSGIMGSAGNTLPPVRFPAGGDDHDIIASPEWWGDGLQAFRATLMRRELAEALVGASPRDFRIVEVEFQA